MTDADVALGRIDPEAFAAGTLRLDRAAAERAVLGRIGAALGLDARWAAAGIGEIVEENMASAARVHAIERGKAAERCTMIAFGGAAPLHAARLAAKLGMDRVLVPVDASVGSAVGFLRAPVAFEVVRSFHFPENSFDFSQINELLEKMQSEAHAIVAAGALGAPLETQRAVEMRYLGQGHEVPVPLPDRPLAAADAVTLRAEYESRYEQQFGLRIADVPVEFLTWSVSVSTAAEKILPLDPPNVKFISVAKAIREVFDPNSGNLEPLPGYQREDLAPGMRLDGPALIVEPQTTTLVPRGWRASVSAAGHLLMERRA